ncbi:hypothetical protein AS156_07665 [Bradyrhizobium macuxiense]|uniref:Uncharacterized protein n=1 Tax=Bradyrhizobium macuxiense TaxID=1755647 RepID=A0A109JS15_9BRAD|nr:hypothetical protein [Bradyrhizobium macuxiense]KWV54098.1 hypothetical protein AS156_07665 [Bradyrhizobium macuxiense]
MRTASKSGGRAAFARDMLMVSRAAHVLQRAGLAMAGAMGGTFVAAQLAKGHVAMFDTLAFIAMLIVIGAVGFYLGIDVPRRPAAIRSRKLDAVELLSASGTFLAAMAALVSVYGIIFDETPSRAWALVIGSWWIGGVAMLATAGLLGRQRLARTVAAISATPGRYSAPQR